MESSDFTAHLDRDPVAPVYLFKGETDFLIEEAWRLLVERIVPPRARRFNGERFFAKECSAAQVLARLNTLPMFGAKQLVMVQKIEAWPKEQRKTIESYAAHPGPAACLVLTTSQKQSKDPLESIVESVGVVVNFAAPSERDIPGWLQARAKRHQKQITFQAAFALIDQAGADLYRLERELEKIVSYVGDRERIEPEDVLQSVSSQRSFTIFELLDMVSQRQSKKAVFSLRKLILSGEAPLPILALLSRQVRIIWQVKDGGSRGTPLSEIGKKLKLPFSVVRNYANQASFFTEAELQRIHRLLRQTDLALKSTGTNPELILEALVLKLCSEKN